ncbi:MAG: Trk system potassium transporter TrkA [Clostridia bacterium]|nr:Trk system potassium transporter TrkA [Clostridia bacterium]
MKIIIAGCGKIGEAILESLVKENHDLVVIDVKPEVIERVTDAYDVIGICGSGTDTRRLLDAGVDKAGLFVATMDSDELNMLSCFAAKRLGAAHTVARIRDVRHNNDNLGYLKEQLELSMIINPERLMAQALYRIIKFPSAMKVESFARRSCEIVEFSLRGESSLCGAALHEMRRAHKANYLICAVQRGGETYIPDGNFVLRKGDRIGLLAAPEEMHKLLRTLGMTQKTARTVMIMGGSRIAYYLAQMLVAGDNYVKIIDRDAARCTELSDLLPGEVVIIHGNGMRQDLLEEEGLQTTDAFVALTGMDEANTLMSFFAMDQKVPKVITKINQREQVALAEKLGLDCIVSPGQITADAVVRYARALANSVGGSVESLYRLMDNGVEALEFSVRQDFKGKNIPLKDLKMKRNILVCSIIRNNKTFIPTGADAICEGDKVIVVAAGMHLAELSDILE